MLRLKAPFDTFSFGKKYDYPLDFECAPGVMLIDNRKTAQDMETEKETNDAIPYIRTHRHPGE
jgi:hypothetical protein